MATPTPEERFDSARLLATKVAAALARGCPSAAARRQAAEELESPALEGLWEAARLYDPASPMTWERFAVHRIRQRVVDYLRVTGGKNERASKRIARQVTRSLDGGRDGRRLSTPPVRPALPEAGTPENFAFWSLIPAGDRELVRLYFFDRLTMREVGAAVGLCESSISQRLTAAIAAAREAARTDPNLN